MKLTKLLIDYHKFVFSDHDTIFDFYIAVFPIIILVIIIFYPIVHYILKFEGLLYNIIY